MAADRHEVYVEVVDIDRHLANCLGRVSVQEDFLGSADLANLLQGLHNSCMEFERDFKGMIQGIKNLQTRVADQQNVGLL